MSKSNWTAMGYTETQAEYLESVEKVKTLGYENYSNKEDLKSASEILVEAMKQYDLYDDEVNTIIDKLNQISK